LVVVLVPSVAVQVPLVVVPLQPVVPSVVVLVPSVAVQVPLVVVFSVAVPPQPPLFQPRAVVSSVVFLPQNLPPHLYHSRRV
jgi:hypothetical protein